MRSLILRVVERPFLPVLLGHMAVFWPLFLFGGMVAAAQMFEDHQELDRLSAVLTSLIHVLGWPLVWLCIVAEEKNVAVGLLACLANSFIWASAATIGVSVWRRWRGRAVVSTP